MSEGAIVDMVVSFIIGLAGAGAGSIVTMAIFKAKLETAHEHLKERISNQEQAHKELKLDIKETNSRTIFRDMCTPCSANRQDRHEETMRMLEETKGRIGELEKSFRTCLEDLVSVLQTEKNHKR